MVEVLSGPERRLRRTPQEKIAIIQQTMEPGMTVSHVARLHGINANQIFKWRKQYEDGLLTAVTSGEEVVPASWLAAANKQIRELQRLLGKKRWKQIFLKKPWSSVGQKNGLRMRPCCPGTTTNRRLPEYWRVACATSVRVNRPSGWQDRRRQSRSDDTAVLSRINMAVADLPTYGYRREWALLRRESERDGLPVVNAKRAYRIMRTHHLLLESKPADPCRKRANKGRVNRRWCSDGFEFRCDNGEKLRVTFTQDCCDREIIDWAASTGGHDKETVQDVMLGAVEKRFGRQLPTESLEWLMDNGSAYRAHETWAFARLLGLEPCTTAVRSPESNGIAESFVKTIKRDYINIMPKPDSRTAVMNLAAAFSHYNEHHPHSALESRSPREYIRRKLSQS
ncbi:TPA: IS3 family transposase [Salmonella enterica subsp. enterica serovar Ball]